MERIISNGSLAWYVTNYGVIGKAADQDAFFDRFSNRKAMIIPSYQRGISWEIDDIKKLVASSSPFLGSVIIARVPPSEDNPPQGKQSQEEELLIDGLQRFAVGTALLRVLSDNQQPIFGDLDLTDKARKMAKWNDEALSEHPRTAIKKQYIALRRALEKELRRENTSLSYDGIISTFLKPLSVDTYTGFSDRIDAMNAFLGINTVRVELGTMDIVRGLIVEKATASRWSTDEIDSLENDFSEAFLDDDKGKPLAMFEPFVLALKKALERSDQAPTIFPSWSRKLDKCEVDTLLKLAQAFKDWPDEDGIYKEITLCGNNPVSILLAHYYRRVLHDKAKYPFFITGENPNSADAHKSEQKELHLYLVACYRALLQGRIGDTGALIQFQKPTTITQLAETISSKYSGTDIHMLVPSDWLTASLEQITKVSVASRVFNAMLLPVRHDQNEKPVDLDTIDYRPLRFGKKREDFTIDHLIARDPKINILTNFTPVPGSANNGAKTSACAVKLGKDGAFDLHVHSMNSTVHPYTRWLVEVHYSKIANKSDLDMPELLASRDSGSVGSERVKKIREELLKRI